MTTLITKKQVSTMSTMAKVKICNVLISAHCDFGMKYCYYVYYVYYVYYANSRPPEFHILDYSSLFNFDTFLTKYCSICLKKGCLEFA